MWLAFYSGCFLGVLIWILIEIEIKIFYYFIFICALVFPALVLFGNETSNLNIFCCMSLFSLLVMLPIKIYMQDKERKRREEYIEDIKDERNYIYDLIDKNANKMTFEELKKYYGDYVTNEEERFRKNEEEYAEDLRKYWKVNGQK